MLHVNLFTAGVRRASCRGADSTRKKGSAENTDWRHACSRCALHMLAVRCQQPQISISNASVSQFHIAQVGHRVHYAAQRR